MTLLNSMRLSDAESLRVHLNRGVFSKNPVLATALRKTLLSVYSNFGEGFERDGNREFAQVSFNRNALDFGYLKPETFSELDDLAETARACLGD
jgi:hypothetical protein